MQDSQESDRRTSVEESVWEKRIPQLGQNVCYNEQGSMLGDMKKD